MGSKVTGILCEINDVGAAILNMRTKRSLLLERLAREVFDEAGLRDGDVIYEGDKAYLFSLADSTVGADGGNILYASLYGRTGARRPKLVAYCPIDEIQQYMLPTTLRRRRGR